MTLIFIIVYCAIYMVGVFIILPVFYGVIECNYYEPAAKVTGITELGIVDTSADCEYSIEWSPFHTPIWSISSRKSGLVHSSLRLPCPIGDIGQIVKDGAYMDGCYSNYMFDTTTPEFHHHHDVSDYDIDFVDVRFFRALGILALSPILLYTTYRIREYLSAHTSFPGFRKCEYVNVNVDQV